MASTSASTAQSQSSTLQSTSETESKSRSQSLLDVIIICNNNNSNSNPSQFQSARWTKELKQWNDVTEELVILSHRRGQIIQAEQLAVSIESFASSSSSYYGACDPSDTTNAANALHSKLMNVLSNHAAGCGLFVRGFESESGLGGSLSGGDSCNIVESSASVSVAIVTDEDANDASLSMAQTISELLIQRGSRDSCIDNTSVTTPTSTTNTNTNDANIVTIETCAELIRACKNIIRWNRMLITNAPRMRNRPNSSSSSPTRMHTPSVDSAARLCSMGMVQLYLTLAEANSRRDESNESSSSLLSSIRDDLARHALMGLFHATYGQAREPCCKKALAALTQEHPYPIDLDWYKNDSKSNAVTVTVNINGISRLVNMLTGAHSVPVMLSVVKNVHNLIGTLPNMQKRMDDAIAISLRNMKNGMENMKSIKPNLFSILVITLAWGLRSQPEFSVPGGTNSKDDRRSELVSEILRVLFALRSMSGGKGSGSGSGSVQKTMEEENPEIMTQLGVILIDILHLSNADRRSYECKLAAIILLMDPPPGYSQFLVLNHGITQLTQILWIQLNEIIVERAGMVQSEQSSTSILPVLIVLNSLSQADPMIKKMVKEYVFPPEEEDMFMEKVQKLRDELVVAKDSSAGSSSGAGKKGSKNMHPLNAPEGSTRWKLIKLMTYTESNVKRCTGELLWTLCDSNSNEFVLRCGFGNAVHMLSIKGLYKIPTSS